MTTTLKTLRQKAKSARKARPVAKGDSSAVRMAQEAARLAADAADMAASDLMAAEEAKAVASQNRAKAEAPNPAVMAVQDTLQMVQQTLAQQAGMIQSLAQMLGKQMPEQQATMVNALATSLEKQNQQMATIMNRPVHVEAGDVEVNMPERQMPTSFTCEFDDGRTATLTPNYEMTH